MPELIHGCGKKVKFPAGTEGRRGRCPHCAGSVEVPGPEDAQAQRSHRLDAPPGWEEYEAYLGDRGPPPRKFVLPSKLMLKTDADERWDRQAEAVPSGFFCPSCKERMNVGQVLCTSCGLDFRTGRLVDGRAKVTPKGMKYLKTVPWLDAARRELRAERDAEPAKNDGDGAAPKALRRRRTPR